MISVRRALIDSNPAQVVSHLAKHGIPATVAITAEGAAITHNADDVAIDVALALFVPDPGWPRALPGDLPPHVAHLQAIRTATAQQLAAMTDAQVRHALQDVVKALALLLDDRLG